jgi:hypothetical protein
MRVTRNMRRFLALTAFTLVQGAMSVSAQNQFPTGTIEYVAKFTCGMSSGGTIVKNGTYATTINIHNPALPGANVAAVTFYKKAVQSVQEPPPAGGTLPSPGTLVTDSLSPDFAEEVDCQVITTKLLPQPAPAGFIEGWVVIYSLPTPGTTVVPNPLDVVAVYTDADGALETAMVRSHQF